MTLLLMCKLVGKFELYGDSSNSEIIKNHFVKKIPISLNMLICILQRIEIILIKIFSLC